MVAVLLITHELWYARLRDRVRAIGTWAVIMRIRARAIASKKARERWRKVWDWWKKSRERAEEEKEHTKEIEKVRKGRQSERLREVKEVQYAEARTWKRKQVKERRAVEATWSTRIGIRLWWWMERGDGWDARGPSSVTQGRSRRVEGDG